MERPKRARVELTVAQKQEICRYYQKHPDNTRKQLQEHFSHQFGLRIGHSTIGTILSRAEHWNSIDFPENVRRTNSTKFANMEQSLFDWICNQVTAVSDEQILEKAAEFVQADDDLAKEWNKVRGWMTSYKRRFNLVVAAEESNESEKRYRPGILPEEREPIHRVQCSKRGRSSAQYSPPQGPLHVQSTSSIIYDAAIENILQDDGDDSDDGDTGGLEEHDQTPPVNESTPNKSAVEVEREVQVRTTKSARKLNIESNSIIQEAAIQNILGSEAMATQNPQVVTTAGTEVIPVTLIETQSSTPATPPVALSSAQSAMKTLLTYFEQNPNTSIDDHNRLHALDAKLKWLGAKEAVGELRTYLSNDGKSHKDVKYLSDLDKRLDGKSPH